MVPRSERSKELADHIDKKRLLLPMRHVSGIGDNERCAAPRRDAVRTLAEPVFIQFATAIVRLLEEAGVIADYMALLNAAKIPIQKIKRSGRSPFGALVLKRAARNRIRAARFRYLFCRILATPTESGRLRNA